MSEELEQKATEPSQMEALLDDQDVLTYSRGDILRGRVVQVSDQGVLVDIGYKSEALMKPTELAPFHKAPLQPGDEIEVLITYIDEEEGTIHVSEKAALYEKRISELERAYRHRLPITGTIEDEVKDAGYHVNLLKSGIRAFLPGSHLGEDLTPNIEELRGKEVPFIILELDRRERNLVVSHREYLKELERQKKEELFSKLQPGQVIEGTIKSIVDFGLFVDIGGFEGLVHRSEISWKDIPVPPNTYKVGDKVTVKVLGVDRSKERISLSIKQLRPDPWIGLKQRYPAGTKTTGTVVSLTDFGAFVRIEEDVEGLVHISELSWGYPEHPREVVKVGQQVEVVVLDVNEQERRVSLSMKRVQPDPWEKIEEKYPEGSIVHGRVTKLADFGAFVHLEDGVEALLHISEMSWDKVNKPSDVVTEGQEITAKVIKSDASKRKIRLSLKELQEDPWHKFLESYSVGSIVEGPITELKDFGAFMKITDDVEGLIHVSEITDERIATPADVLQVGQTVKARIIGINEEKRQVRLSMRNLHKQEHLVTSSDAGHEAITMGERIKGLKELLKGSENP
ncbi:30S ribosomal protein S1 [bacterium HR07]|uniref:30S ribosomal protein S1 n=1 Tax=Acetithermum autotrophicum TaxID=1446466 RepID=H5ST90_ACEAU|nr:30S ribosomal protein S1 [Candidatus Acetothermum autotrophicum]GBC76025.1 30S ribosomal protein S1 [bacterium HR07]